MGSEFIPSLDEGDIALHALRIPGTSLTQAVDMQTTLEGAHQGVPGGRARCSPRSARRRSRPTRCRRRVADSFMMLKTATEWPDPRKPKVAAGRGDSKRPSQEIPGNNYEFTQPIQMRFNELIAGVRSDVGVKVFGDDLEQLMATRRAGRRRCCSQVAGRRRRQDRAGHGPAGADDQARTAPRWPATGSTSPTCRTRSRSRSAASNAGQVFEGDRRFDIVVRLPETICARTSRRLQTLPIPLPAMTQAAPRSLRPGQCLRALRTSCRSARWRTLEIAPGPNQISRENGKRRVVVTANVRGRDLGSFVDEAAERRSSEQVEAAGGLLDRLGRHVRAADLRQQAAAASSCRSRCC